MRTIIIMILMSMGYEALAKGKESWFCIDEAGNRIGNTYQSCGVGEAPDEATARAYALANAINEYKALCETSTDCKNREMKVESKRMTCTDDDYEDGHWKCYRLILVHILGEKKT